MSNKCDKNCKNQDINLKGPRGFRGEAGPTGPQGPSGPQGIQGVEGPSNPADIDIITIDDITVSSVTVGDLTTYTIGRDIIDTGWVDLEGFAYYQGAMATNKPQVRRMDNQVHFRGDLIIPIADGGGAAVPITTADTYRTTLRATPQVSTGNTFIDSNGDLFFNSTGTAGGVVIPTSVLGPAVNLDNSYQLNREFAERQIILDYLTAFAIGNSGTALMSAPIKVTISSDKKLKITSLQAREENSADVVNFHGASPLNKLSSRAGIRFPAIDNSGNYISAQRVGDSSSLRPIVSGALTIGSTYSIQTLQAGDDFTNVGFDIANGTTFIATGTTPTNWTNFSVLWESRGGFNREMWLGGILDAPTGAFDTPMYPFFLDTADVNTSDITNLGGFKISLDGLIAYLAP